MAGKITADVLSSYLLCKYKGYLRLAGETGSKSEYETFRAELCQGFPEKAVEKLLSRNVEGEVVRNLLLAHRLLKCGSPYIIAATLEGDEFFLTFDALKKVDGASKLGSFHYVPVLFHSHAGTAKPDPKRLIALYGYVLSGVQGRWPGNGVIIYGPECRVQKTAFGVNRRKASQVLHEIRVLREVATPPPLILNDQCQICEFGDRCRASAAARDDLSLLRGMSENEVKQHNRRGIFTVTQLSYTYRPRRKSARTPQATPRHNFALQALAIREKRVFLAAPPIIPTEPVCIYLDVEGIPERKFYYLIGATVCTATSTAHHTFWADSPTEEPAILTAFLDLAATFEGCRVFHYGSYETTFLKRMRSLDPLAAAIDRVLATTTNILSLIYGRVYFPVYSNGLKDVASFLGYAWRDKAPSGVNSMIWRHTWDATGSPELKDRLIAYNQDDCNALKVVADFIRGLSIQTLPNGGSAAEDTKRFQIESLPEPKPQFTRPNWGTPEFAESDFECINRCAYFDYQRERIYAHSSEVIARQQAGRKRRPRKLRPQGTVLVESSPCPACGSGAGSQLAERKSYRQFFDLRITVGHVRSVFRRVASYKYRCAKCGLEHFPKDYQQMAKFGHALKSWTIYEHVTHRTSFESLEETLRELFGLSVRFQDIHVFKSIMANYYKETYLGIVRRLSQGALIHADETEVHLKRVGKGYVWVFTSLEEVAYVYRTSRDGKFLAKMFAGFSGVLVSDFYAAYDSLSCPQQKCLVHLIRDLNTQLLANPFDPEFKSVAAEFGGLLRQVVATVDRFGLKKRHLGKHQREVDQFFRRLSGKSFSSDAARMAQERLLRNQNTLFTFLRYDGVPWNNNNAEHAIKQFAYYREVTDGQLSEAGLMDYLVLLSIRQTCEYKGLGFLKFLLSRETDLGSYRERNGTGKRAAEIEVSPLEREFFDRTLRHRAPPVQWTGDEGLDSLGNDR